MAKHRKLLEAHSRFSQLLDTVRPQILSHDPLSSPASASEHLLVDLATLTIRFDELEAHFTRERRKTRHKIDEAGTDDGAREDSKRWTEWADALDRDGVGLWNKTAEFKSLANVRDDGGVAALAIVDRLLVDKGKEGDAQGGVKPSKRRRLEVRRLAFGMICAGSPLEADRDEKATVRLVDIATKTIGSLLGAEDVDAATKIVEAAATHATFLESLSNDLGARPDGLKRRSALIKLYVARADCAWATSNPKATLFNLKRAIASAEATSDGLALPVVVNERTTLASRLYDFSHQGLSARRRVDPATSSDLCDAKRAVEWLSVALEVLDVPILNSTDAKDARSPIADLKIKIVSLLAQACFDAAETVAAGRKGAEETDEARQMKARGERALDEALELAPSEHLWRQKIKLLKQRTDNSVDLVEAYESLFKAMDFTEDSVMRMLQQVDRIGNQADRVAVLSRLFIACVTLPDPEEQALGAPVFHSVLLSVTSTSNGARKTWHATNMERVAEVTDAAASLNPTFRLSTSAAFSAQTIIWRQGDLAYAASAFADAANWYQLGMRPIFSQLGTTTGPKFARKAAISWVRAGEMAKVEEALGAVVEDGGTGWKGKAKAKSRDDAGDELVRFFAAVVKKDEAAGARSVERILSSPMFNPSMLLFAAKQAADAGLKDLFTSILAKVLDVVASSGGVLEGVDSMALLRCLLRSSLGRLNEPNANIHECVPKIIEYYRSVLRLCQREDLDISTGKAISWFWKTAFNACVVNGCGPTPWPPPLLCDLFDVAGDLIVFAKNIPGSLTDQKELTARECHCRFASLAAKVSQAKANDSDEAIANAMGTLVQDIARLRETLQTAPQDARVGTMLSTIFVWSVEIHVVNQDWPSVVDCLKDAVLESPVPVAEKAEALEAAADLVCFEPSCPGEVVAEVLHVGLSHPASPTWLTCYLYRQTLAAPICELRSAESERFAQWIRLALEITFLRNDNVSALRFLKQALDKIRRDAGRPTGSSKARYPPEETSWLLSTAWDRVLGLSAAAQYAEAKEWCESVVELVPYAPDGPSHEAMIRRHYRDILNRVQASGAQEMSGSQV